MNCPDCIERLDDHVDGNLRPAEARRVDAHLSECAACREQLQSLRALLTSVTSLPREIPPRHDLWSGISEELAHRQTVGAARQTRSVIPKRSASRSPDAPGESLILRWLAPIAMAASVVFVASLAERSLAPRLPGWSVAATAGAPRVGSQAVRAEGKIHLGQWLVTDADSRAKVSVGSIGEVHVEPNSRLRLVGVAATDHRLELARGEMSAFIAAPPRLFFVNTPSATAVDLGCAYTLGVDDDGNGELHVSSGYVSLEDRGNVSIVRMGMMCLTRRGVGPGTPFSEDAPDALRAALTRFDFEPGGAASALGEVLVHARPDDAVTLWHLLARTQGTQRAAVFDRLVKLAPPPASVTRAGILAGSVAMQRAWAAELGLDRF